jgi:hypothetical protein
MPHRSVRRFAAFTLVTAALLGLSAAGDPIASEVERWSAFVEKHPATGENWDQIKAAATPLLERARTALAKGRRWLALQRLAPARVYLAATTWIDGEPAKTKEDAAAFEAEWTRMGGVLKASLEKPRPASLDGISPAAVRAVAESSLPQIRAYYEAALEYGRATGPGTGLYYVGLAQAHRDMEAFCRSISTRGGPPAPPLRSLEPELDALETELLALYRPPVSIDRHGDFISASATLKEARELDAAGLRYGALLRLLLAAQRVSMLVPAAGSAEDVRADLDRFERRIDEAAAKVDHTIARIFTEAAEADLDGTSAPLPGSAQGDSARAIARGVLPRYFAALEPAPPRAPRPDPTVTVTLVRWPYT